MRVTISTHKIECFPNSTQIEIINKTLGACRWIYNSYIGLNIENYKNGIPFISAYEFSKRLTAFKKDPESNFYWLNDISQKAVKESIIDAHKTYKKFFNKQGGFPKFKSLKRNPVTSYYLYPVKGEVKHNKLLLPILGWMRIRENNYVPKGHIINARMIKNNLGKFFIQLSEYVECEEREILSPAIGIDIGIKEYLSVAREDLVMFQFKSFLKDDYLKNLENKCENLQRIISKKVEINYGKLLNTYMDKNGGKTPSEIEQKIMKGESYNSTKIYKVKMKLRRTKKKISDYKDNKINHMISKLVKTKPEYISMEDLSIRNMISCTKEDHVTTLSKHIQDSKFYYFKNHLINKCKFHGIEIHLANRYFASSKICSCCGKKKDNLSLSNRVFKCDYCDYEIDRDLNAAVNLLHMKKKNYSII